MLAIRVREFGAPEVMRLEEVPNPVAGPGQIVVKVHAAGVNPVEAYVRSGVYARLPDLPYTPGADVAGTVIAVGEGVTAFRVDDWVYTSGTLSGAYAEQALCGPGQVFPLPPAASFAQGAALGIPYGTAWRALFSRGRAKAGETVLVHGASGGVGTAVVQLAVRAGLSVIGTSGTERGRQLVREQGARHALSHEEGNDPVRVRELTGGLGPDLILEMLANKNLGRDLGLLAPGGRVVVIGSRGPVEIDPRQTMAGELDILGMMLAGASAEERTAMYADIDEGLEDQSLRPVVNQELALGDAPLAHHEIMESSAYGKIVLVPVRRTD
jgi:NADPH2:quinone reductase